jgi:hypothetical protein
MKNILFLAFFVSISNPNFGQNIQFQSKFQIGIETGKVQGGFWPNIMVAIGSTGLEVRRGNEVVLKYNVPTWTVNRSPNGKLTSYSYTDGSCDITVYPSATNNHYVVINNKKRIIHLFETPPQEFELNITPTDSGFKN